MGCRVVPGVNSSSSLINLRNEVGLLEGFAK